MPPQGHAILPEGGLDFAHCFRIKGEIYGCRRFGVLFCLSHLTVAIFQNNLLRAVDYPRPMLPPFPGGQGWIHAGDGVRVLQSSAGTAVYSCVENAATRLGKDFQDTINELRE